MSNNAFKEQADRISALKTKEAALHRRFTEISVKKEHVTNEIAKIESQVQEEYGISEIHAFRDFLSAKKEENLVVIQEIETQQAEFDKALGDIEKAIERIENT